MLVDVAPSGGQFPASIAVHDDLAYVLNSGGTGIVQGFRIGRQGLRPISDSARSLGLANTTRRTSCPLPARSASRRTAAS